MAGGGILHTGGNGRRSTCVVHEGIVYTSGITSVNLDADIQGQATDVLAQMDRILALHGTDKRRVLFASVTLADMADFGGFNAVWDTWVEDGFEPARSVVGGALPLREYRVKISLTAALP